jgi:hypothetical protein
MLGMVWLAEIELDGRCVRTQLGGSLLESRSIPAGEHHRTPTALELSGDEAPQHSRTAEYERASANKITCSHVPLIVVRIFLADPFSAKAAGNG